MNNMKVALAGSSGSGKTTLVKFVQQELGLEWISGSAGDLYTPEDVSYLQDMLKHPGGGHHGVIAYSALNSTFAIQNQQLLLLRRTELFTKYNNFVTDRSPADNLTYFVSQCGYHPEVTDQIASDFIDNCKKAWGLLTHVVYIKAVQPNAVENNGSRISNKYYQKAIDAQFEMWIDTIFKYVPGPRILCLDYWDLDKRKEAVLAFLKQSGI